MTEARRIAATLLHDVGKYVARTSRNVREGTVLEGKLAAMLLDDVYGAARGPRPSSRFDELVRELEDVGIRDARIDRARSRLAAIDAREAAARAGDPDALRAIAIDARAIEDALRGLVKDLGKRSAEGDVPE